MARLLYEVIARSAAPDYLQRMLGFSKRKAKTNTPDRKANYQYRFY
jgi:hypothetical protein